METFVLNLTWLIPVFPLLAFAIIVLYANPHKALSTWLTWIGIGLSWIISWGVLAVAILNPHLAEEPYQLTIRWLPTGLSEFRMGVLVDPLTAAMLFMVPFVCLMIFIYSKGYMNFGTELVDPRYSRFFAYISLFACGMLGLVVAGNLLMLFIFWEVMGLCSYLLIGFWFEKSYPDPRRITPKQAGLKAFLTTRVGDVILFSGMALLYVKTGTLSFTSIFTPETLHHLAESTVTLPFLGSMSWSTLIALLVFGGAVGKSAQFPLHVWLPDAMEGPTPVSALIHAATMVSAGVYLVARMFPLFAAANHGHNAAMSTVAFIGAFTALFASSIAVAQNDIKRVLAYSTISQLGYMMAALGIGAYIAGVFHLLTHAFFKALLFLGSGSVIHGVEHGHHHLARHRETHEEHGKQAEEFFDANDMMNMGGLLPRMPRTAWTFIIGGLALSGFPILTAGFWSKDEILGEAWANGHVAVFWTLAVAALLTAFYTGRQICLTFLGRPRTEAAAHAPESVPSITVPLVILASFAVVGGWVGIPESFPVLGVLVRNPFHHFLGRLTEALGIHAETLPFHPFPVLVSVVVALGGLTLGWLVYGRRPLETGDPDPLESWLGPVHTLLKNKYYFDELYQLIIIRPVIWLSNLMFRLDDHWVVDPIVDGVGRFGRWLSEALRRWFDTLVIEGIVNGVGQASAWCGQALRYTQTGRVQNYLLVLLMTLLMLLALHLYW